MELREEQNGWYLALQEGFVQLIQIDFRLGLFLSDVSGRAKLYVGEPCHLRDGDSDDLLVPTQTLSLAPALSLFNTKVTGIAIHQLGRLRLQFDDGRILEVGPNDAFEAWELGCSTGLMMVCSPGGKVLIFK